jgi:hypothetical protein
MITGKEEKRRKSRKDKRQRAGLLTGHLQLFKFEYIPVAIFMVGFQRYGLRFCLRVASTEIVASHFLIQDSKVSRKARWALCRTVARSDESVKGLVQSAMLLLVQGPQPRSDESVKGLVRSAMLLLV